VRSCGLQFARCCTRKPRAKVLRHRARNKRNGCAIGFRNKGSVGRERITNALRCGVTRFALSGRIEVAGSRALWFTADVFVERCRKSAENGGIPKRSFVPAVDAPGRTWLEPRPDDSPPRVLGWNRAAPCGSSAGARDRSLAASAPRDAGRGRDPHRLPECPPPRPCSSALSRRDPRRARRRTR